MIDELRDHDPVPSAEERALMDSSVSIIVKAIALAAVAIAIGVSVSELLATEGVPSFAVVARP
jgi:hypothetical protein